MGTMGKVLAVLNVLAAIGFLVIASADYGKRQSWIYANQQAEFLIEGIPLDEQAKNRDGTPLVAMMTGRMQSDLGLADVKTQAEEAGKRKAAALQAINSAEDDAARIARAEAVLLPVASTQGERDQIRAMLKEKSPSEVLDAISAEAVDGKSRSGQQLSPDARQKAIAHFLITLNEAPQPALDRVQKVVGLRNFSREIDLQVQAIQNMIPTVRSEIKGKETEFALQHNTLLADVLAQRDRLGLLDTEIAKYDQIRQDNVTLTNQRQQELKQLNEAIAAAEKSAMSAKAEQARLEQELFAARQAIRQKQSETSGVLSAIRGRETGR